MADRADLIVICGPTATGKTAAAASLARLLDGEVVSADSMQIYQGLRIGTAQPTPEEMAGVPHHLVGFLPPEEGFSVADYVARATQCIREIRARGRVPIVAGGTGLYLSSLVNGIDFTVMRGTPQLRARLEAELMQQGAEAMYRRLQQADPEAAARLCPADRVRVLRALEWYEQTGQTARARIARSRPAQKPFCPLLFGLMTAERAQLYARIDARVDAMLQAGLLSEARRVYTHRAQYRTAAQAIGYKEFFSYFEGTATLEDCTALLKRASRRYAKRQLTWFRHMEGIVWLNADPAAVGEMARRWQQCSE